MKSIVNPQSVGKPLVAYSNGVHLKLPGFQILFMAGQLPIDNRSNLVAPGDIDGQAEHVFRAIGAILSDAGLGFKDVVKATIFVTDMSLFPRVSAIRNKYFEEARPATSFVEVSRLVKDGSMIEVEVIALAEDSP